VQGLIKAYTREKINFSCNSKIKKMKKSRKTKTKKPTKNLNEMTPKGAERRKELEEQFRARAISLIREEGLWLL